MNTALKNCCLRLYTDDMCSTANKYYSSVGHHEQKNKKTTCQIKFLAVPIKQQSYSIVHVNKCKCCHCIVSYTVFPV